MTQLEITFLGTTAGIPTKWRNHASLYIRYQSENEFCMLFDCGEGTQKQIFSAGLNFMRIDNIFITHWHADHFAGLLGLLETMNLEGRKKPLNIYGPEACNFVEGLLDLGYAKKGFEVNAIDVNFDGTEITTVFDNSEFCVQSAPMKHGIPAVAYAFVEKDRVKIDSEKAGALGLPKKGPVFGNIKKHGSADFRGKKIMLEDIAKIEKGKKAVYSGDTMPNSNMIKLAEGADFLMHDATFFDEEDARKHANLGEVMKIAEKANAKQIILTHISRRYQDVEEMKKKIEKYDNVKIAKDFMKVVV